MTIDDKIRDEKLQYDINREAAKISGLSSGKIDKYQYLKGEEILPSIERQIKEQAQSTYSSLGEAFEKQTKAIEDQRKRQIKAIQDHEKQFILSNDLIKNDLNIDKDGIPLEKQRKILNELVEENSFGFPNLKE